MIPSGIISLLLIVVSDVKNQNGDNRNF